MVYLSRRLGEPREDGYVLDQDYERSGAGVKRLSGGGLPKKIVPDMIVHRRGGNNADDNLLVIEVKVSDQPAGILHDRAKLKVLTGNVGSVDVYGRWLRLPDEAEPRLARPRGSVSLPPDMSPYRYGVSVMVSAHEPPALTWFERPEDQEDLTVAGREYAGL
jgi:hypothetical protein